jgi:hypothetical protein
MEQFFASVTPGSDDGHCCRHEKGDIQNPTGSNEMMLTDDCCSHEAERIVTDELVRSEVQNEILPYLLAASIVSVIPERSHYTGYTYSDDKTAYGRRDLTTMLCQIIS